MPKCGFLPTQSGSSRATVDERRARLRDRGTTKDVTDEGRRVPVNPLKFAPVVLVEWHWARNP
jgi:hypothetical protein